MDNFENNSNNNSSSNYNAPTNSSAPLADIGPMSSAPVTQPTVADWMITMLITAIPCVGIIMMFVWAFEQANSFRKNYARAALVWTAIIYVISFILYFTVIVSMIGSMGMYY